MVRFSLKAIKPNKSSSDSVTTSYKRKDKLPYTHTHTHHPHLDKDVCSPFPLFKNGNENLPH